MLLCIVGGLVAAVSGRLLKAHRGTESVAVVVGYGIIVLGYASHVARVYLRTVRRLRLTGYKLCRNCEYDLSELTQQNTRSGRIVCPECGTEFDVERDIKWWRSVVM